MHEIGEPFGSPISPSHSFQTGESTAGCQASLRGQAVSLRSAGRCAKLNALATTCVCDTGPAAAIGIGLAFRTTAKEVAKTKSCTWLLNSFEAVAVLENFARINAWPVATNERLACSVRADRSSTHRSELETGRDKWRRIRQLGAGGDYRSSGCGIGELLTQINWCHRDLLWTNHEHHLATLASSIAEPKLDSRMD